MSVTKHIIHIGETVDIELPYSEVCIHMRVAGKVRPVTLIANTRPDGTASYPMAQILNLDGSPFSMPVTYGEAGIYRDGGEFYITRIEHLPEDGIEA